jgi:hypothetical protein
LPIELGGLQAGPKGKVATAGSFAASVLSTGALETTVASCLATRLVGGDQTVLEAVLAAFLPPSATAAAKPLATTVAQLSAALVNEVRPYLLPSGCLLTTLRLPR